VNIGKILYLAHCLGMIIKALYGAQIRLIRYNAFQSDPSPLMANFNPGVNDRIRRQSSYYS
jgi:hypothetical protein